MHLKLPLEVVWAIGFESIFNNSWYIFTLLFLDAKVIWSTQNTYKCNAGDIVTSTNNDLLMLLLIFLFSVFWCV